MSMKQITLDGRVGKDGAKVMKTATGKDYIRFSLANDSFVDGTNKTEWFDVTSFDPYIVGKRSDFLRQGRYVIVTGSLKSEVASKNGKIYLNHYVTATNIEFPSVGGKKEESNEVQVSTFTGGTKSQEVAQAPAQAAPQAAPAPQPVAQAAQSAPAGWTGEDDLPF